MLQSARKIATLRQARILVADDFASWRNQVSSLLKTRPDWSIVGEASDGQQAVEKAIETQPDVILLDVGMPSLNGLEAAKIIRQRCPKSKILFLTLDGDGDVRDAAMRLGAVAYLLKTHVGNQLFDAISNALDC